MTRTRRVLLLALAALAVGAALRGGVALVEAALEGKVRERLVAEAAAQRGFALSVDGVRVRLPFRVSLSWESPSRGAASRRASSGST